MDLLSFIRTADPMNVRVAERQRAEDEPRLLETIVGRVVSLLLVASARASSELEASVDKLFDEGVGGDGQDADIQPVIATTNTIVEDVAPLQPRRERKRKNVVVDASRPSHPPKKLREDYGALGGASAAGKSRSVVQSLFAGDVLNVEARGEPIPTLPFITSSVSATPEREDKSPADSVTGLNLRTISDPQRFVISSDSFHHFGANISEAEVDSSVRSPAIVTVTTMTATVDAATMADIAPVEPSLFGVGSSSTDMTDSVPGGFSDVFGSDFLISGIRTVVKPDFDLQKVYVLQLSVTNGFGLDDNRVCHEMLDEFSPPKFFASVRGMDHDQLFIEFNVGAVRQISLSVEVRMRAKYNIREKRRLRSVVDEHAELLNAIRLRAEVFKLEATKKSLQGEVRVLRDHSATLEKEKNELSVKVTVLSASVKVREQEVTDLEAQVIAVKLQNDNLVGQVHELKISYAGLQEKVVVYEYFIGQFEKFQDEKMEEVNEKFDKLCADFVEMALHLEEKFYPHLLTNIYGRRWLLTHGMELAIVKCLNLTEYLSVLGATISEAVEKGMQEGLSRLQNVNFSLITELKSNKDASVDTIMNLLRLDDTHAERKIRENIASHVSALRGVFVPLSEPLSVTALEGTKGTFGSSHDTTTALSVTFVFAGTIPPISTDDYEVAHADGQEGASVDGETAADENIDPFSDVSNAKLNVLE
nr:hypothetical protein [Tanacetum cinerariifolium]